MDTSRREPLTRSTGVYRAAYKLEDGEHPVRYVFSTVSSSVYLSRSTHKLLSFQALPSAEHGVEFTRCKTQDTRHKKHKASTHTHTHTHTHTQPTKRKARVSSMRPSFTTSPIRTYPTGRSIDKKSIATTIPSIYTFNLISAKACSIFFHPLLSSSSNSSSIGSDRPR